MGLRGTAAGDVGSWLLIEEDLLFYHHRPSQAKQKKSNESTLMPVKTNRAYTESFSISPELTKSTTLIP